MKKSFLLRTVSGILLYSYSGWSYASPEIATIPSSAQTAPTTPATRPTGITQSLPVINNVMESNITGQNGGPVLETPSRPLSGESALAPSTPASLMPLSLIRAILADEKLSMEHAASLQPLKPVKPIRIEEERPSIESTTGDTVTQHNIKMHNKVTIADARNKNSIIKLIGGTASSDFIGFSVSNGGTIEAKDITVTAPVAGMTIANATVLLKDSTVIVTNDTIAHGIVIKDTYSALPSQNTEERNNSASLVNSSNIVLNNTKLFVENGTAIDVYGSSANTKISLKDAEIRTDVLLKNTQERNAPANTFTLIADHSLLEGRVRTLEESRTALDLKKGTRWLLKTNKNMWNDDRDSSDYAQFDGDKKSYSNLSSLKLADSMIIFDKPVEGHYQTLFVGSNTQKESSDTPVVYSTTGKTEIYLNSQWSDNSPVNEQKTDRLLIDGDVSGTTIVHINLLKKDEEITDGDSWEEKMALFPVETHGISVIQVSGKADKNSFKLAGNYMAIEKSPYKYVLASYAPGTSRARQNLFGENNRNFWDFRLQNAYIDKDKKIRALLPQVANYTLTPNSLFSAGFSDVNNQNLLLDNMQATVFGTENNKKKAILLSSYGERVTLSSNRDPLYYGYGADVDYNAVQMGIALAALERKDIRTHFGLLGTYGKLAFTPKDMEDSEKTTLDKWSFTIYGGVKHDSGAYVNTLLSYGTVKGNITTALVGNVAKLDGTGILNISATLGKKLATAMEGLIFEPQAQFIYQNLMFDTISDANNLEVDMGNQRQWLVRLGGRLTRILTTLEEGKALSFYSRLNVIKTFGDDRTIKIADTFYLDPIGASIEGGVGINAHLSQNIALYGDISYRKKLQKSGVSGTSFSGGIRYHF